MKTRIKTLIVISSILFFASCGSKKRSVSNQTKQNSTNKEAPITEESKVYEQVGTVKTAPKNLNLTESYIYQFADIAKQEMRLFGIPASITLAQGILESGNGQGNLTSRSKNHFGIKCNNWKGAKVYHDDDEAQECFRKYTHAEYSYRDHSLFLFNRSRYGFLFDYDISDYKAWAKGLKKAGYATDPKYPNKLIGLIERYELFKYDEEVASTFEINKLKKLRAEIDINKGKDKQNNNRIHIVKKGDTLYSISKKYDVELDSIIEINKIQNNIISVGQELKLE